jgi:hypothetical protein
LLEKAFLTYLAEGGFPDAQSLEARDRSPLLQGYVDVAVLSFRGQELILDITAGKLAQLALQKPL